MEQNNSFGTTEDVISMFLGLLVVIFVVFVIYNLISRRKGNISIPGISIKTEQEVKEPLKNDSSSDMYIVQKGDSLWKIAQAKLGNGNMWTKIANENNVKLPNQIEIGQKLVISSEQIKTPVSDTYQVKKGDSLWKIAAINFGDGFKWTNIWNLNRKTVVNPNRLETGMVLKLR